MWVVVLLLGAYPVISHGPINHHIFMHEASRSNVTFSRSLVRSLTVAVLIGRPLPDPDIHLARFG